MRSLILALLAYFVVVIMAESDSSAITEDPCNGENGTEELCAFRILLQNTLQRVNEALASQDMDKRKSSYVRFGRSFAGNDLDTEKRKSSYVRFGRSDPSDDMSMEKRKSAFVRFGRSDARDSADKRKSSYIRFG